MKRLISMAALAAVAGLCAASPADAQRAGAKKRAAKPAAARPESIDDLIQEGGPVSCFDASRLSAYERGVMERAGGVPCANSAVPARQPTAPARSAAPAAARSRPPASTNWIVGGWAVSASDCARKPDLILDADGTYDGMGFELGSWALSGETLTLTALYQYEAGQAAQPIPYPKPIAFTVRPTGPGRMSFARVGNEPQTLTRCR